MKIMHVYKKPLYYATIYITPLSEHTGMSFNKISSMLVAMAGTELGYTGIKNENTADGRTVCVCYWDSFSSLSRWTEKAEKILMSSKLSLSSIICTTGCLWPWLIEKRTHTLENITQKAA